jgi:predicted TIM-barrel enzyme
LTRSRWRSIITSKWLHQVKQAVPKAPIFTNIGVCLSNIERMLSVADGPLIGMSFKRNPFTYHNVRVKWVCKFTEKAKEVRT